MNWLASWDMTVEELKQRMDAGDDLFVLDVREPNEYQICNLGGHPIPLNDLAKRVGELDACREIVVHCKMGGRSAKAVDYLKQQASATCTTSPAELTPGPSASIPRCRSIERSAIRSWHLAFSQSRADRAKVISRTPERFG